MQNDQNIKKKGRGGLKVTQKYKNYQIFQIQKGHKVKLKANEKYKKKHNM